eukprot:g4876.t1
MFFLSHTLLQSPSGAGFDANSSLRLCDAANSSGCEALDLLQPWDRGVKFVVPATRPLAVWSVRAAGDTEIAVLNDAEPWWSMCEGAGDAAAAPPHAGAPSACIAGVSTVRVLGRSLAFNASGCTPYATAAGGANSSWLRLAPLGAAPSAGPALRAALQAAAPGDRVTLPAGSWAMEQRDRLVVGDGVTLRGAGAARTVLRWPAQTGADCLATGWPSVRAPLISGPAQGAATGWAVEDLAVVVVGGLRQNDTRATCPVLAPCAGPGCAARARGMALRRLNISVVASGRTGVDGYSAGVGMGAAVELFGAGNAVVDSDIAHDGDCGSNVTPLLSVAGDRTRVARNRFRFGCTLYSARSVTRMLWHGNTATHLGGLGRDGSVIATFGFPFRVEFVAFLGNEQTDNPVTPPGATPPASAHRLEGMTLDGGGGAYTGQVRAAGGGDATAVTLAADPFGNGTGAYSPWAGPALNWTGAAMLVLSGRGAGQWRHVAHNAGRDWRVARPWGLLPDASSLVQVAPLRGHITLLGNTWATAYTVQLYGMALSAVVAENTFDATPFYVWGRNPHYWGYQPNWRVEVLDNTLPRSRGLTTLSCDERFDLCHEGANPGPYNGAMNSGVVLRRNTLSDGQGVALHGTSSDVVVERLFVHNAAGAFMKQPVDVGNTTDHVLLRDIRADA